MKTLGARPGDIRDCLLGGNTDACRRVYFGYYLWPRLQNLLEQLKLIHSPIPPRPWPEPDPSPWLLQELVPVLLAPYLGDPNPQPNLPIDSQLKTMIDFRNGLQDFVKELDNEIESLEKRAKNKC